MRFHMHDVFDEIENSKYMDNKRKIMCSFLHMAGQLDFLKRIRPQSQ